jgi:CxxC-x17-CxxC domain-containing protein
MHARRLVPPTDPSFVDRELECRGCGTRFSFSAGEQRFHAARGLRTDPKRCQRCRDARKERAKREAIGSAHAAAPLYDGVCATCGAVARVTFRPAPGRPIHCGECYQLRSQRGAELA